MQPIDTAIVGAGPYGLSVAAHLRVAGVPHEIFGEPLESWRSFMPQGMKLKSEPFASNLWDPAWRFTYRKYLAENGIAYRPVFDPVPVERFLEYAQWFRRHAVDDVRRVKVRRCGAGRRRLFARARRRHGLESPAGDPRDGPHGLSQRSRRAQGFARRNVPAQHRAPRSAAVCRSRCHGHRRRSVRPRIARALA